MTRTELEHIIRAVVAITNENELTPIGSQAMANPSMTGDGTRATPKTLRSASPATAADSMAGRAAKCATGCCTIAVGPSPPNDRADNCAAGRCTISVVSASPIGPTRRIVQEVLAQLRIAVPNLARTAQVCAFTELSKAKSTEGLEALARRLQGPGK